MPTYSVLTRHPARIAGPDGSTLTVASNGYPDDRTADRMAVAIAAVLNANVPGYYPGRYRLSDNEEVFYDDEEAVGGPVSYPGRGQPVTYALLASTGFPKAVTLRKIVMMLNYADHKARESAKIAS